MKAARDLRNDLPQIIASGEMDSKDLIFVVSRIRKIMEVKGFYRENCKLLNLFCNWCLHTSLTKSRVAHRMLYCISREFSVASKPGEKVEERTERFIETAANLISIPRLRKELRLLLADNSIDTTVTDEKKWWDGFVTILLFEVTDKPLTFPKDVLNGSDSSSKSYRIYKQILDLSKHQQITTILISYEESSSLHEGNPGFVISYKTLSRITLKCAMGDRECESESEFSS